MEGNGGIGETLIDYGKTFENTPIVLIETMCYVTPEIITKQLLQVGNGAFRVRIINNGSSRLNVTIYWVAFSSKL